MKFQHLSVLPDTVPLFPHNHHIARLWHIISAQASNNFSSVRTFKCTLLRLFRAVSYPGDLAWYLLRCLFFYWIDQIHFLSSWFARTIFTNIGIICKYLSATAFTSDHQEQYQVAIPSSNQLFFSWLSAKLHNYANRPVYSQNSAKLEIQIFGNYMKHFP